MLPRLLRRSPKDENNADLGNLIRERDEARSKLSDLEGKLKEVSNEAKGHRLNSDRFRGDLDKARDEFRAAQTAHEAAVEVLRAELIGKMTETETKAAETMARAQARTVAADLRVAAQAAGLIDLDLLKLVDASKVKLDADGNVLNAAEILDETKKAKPAWFGQATTGNPAPAPAPAAVGPKQAKDMTREERTAAARDLGLRLPR